MEGVVKVNDPMKTFEVTTHDEKEEWTNRYELTPCSKRRPKPARNSVRKERAEGPRETRPRG